ncbi:MAG: FHA domain-containing protein [Pseudomonadota bacterium]
MDEIIWVEVLSKHRDVVARYRCSGPEIHIGRGYDNDVVVDDPYVAPVHICVARDERGALVATDLGSANGLFSDKDVARMERIAIEDDDVVRIGRTYLRIREAKHAVAPERILKPSHTRSWITVFYLTMTLLGMSAISAWFGETIEPKLSHYIFPMLATAFITLVWTALWAILSRVFSSHANFEANLLIALKGFLLFSLCDVLVDYVAFSFSLGALFTYEYVAAWLLFAAICFFHLRAIGLSRLRLKGGAVAVLAVIAIATQTLVQSENNSSKYQQSYVRRLKPPAFRLVPQKSEPAFFSSVEELKAKLDKARTDEPISDGIFGGSDSDD